MKVHSEEKAADKQVQVSNPNPVEEEAKADKLNLQETESRISSASNAKNAKQAQSDIKSNEKGSQEKQGSAAMQVDQRAESFVVPPNDE